MKYGSETLASWDVKTILSIVLASVKMIFAGFSYEKAHYFVLGNKVTSD
jgi:hypothetical protein